MKINVRTDWTVRDLVELKKENFLQVNPEYQRGLRWTSMQKCMFIDSIMRGYSIPAFYLHKIERAAGTLKSESFDIVDGQQRIDAIYGYSEGEFALVDPADESGFRFPNFVKDTACPWGGKRFGELSEDMREKLLSQEVVVYDISTENKNAIRDLFIRLQGGTPLTPQDKRDSWPGNFTEFVLSVGGKGGVPKWPGDPLFKRIRSMANESRRRQLVAQAFMLLWNVRTRAKFCDIKSANIDAFYHAQVGFDRESDEARAFLRVCKELHTAIEDKPTIPGHYIIHSVLLVDSLVQDYVSGTWEDNLARSLHEFETRRRKAADAAKKSNRSEYAEYYEEYGRWTSTQSDTASTIRRRHAFFAEKMLSLIGSKKKVRNRQFTDLERKIVFFRDREMCQWCRMSGKDHKTSWDDCHIHHVKPHAQGGTTDIVNAALMHKDCHPRNENDVEEFGQWWSRQIDPAIPDV